MSYGAPYGYGSGYGYGVTGGYNPFADTSLALWLDADYGLFQERTGALATTPASADGDPVGTWRDRRGVIQATNNSDSSRPVYRPAGVNGRRSVEFDGTDDRFLLSGAGGNGILRNRSYVAVSVGIVPAAEAATAFAFSASFAASDSVRFGLVCNPSNTSGSLQAVARVADSGGAATATAASAFTNDESFVLTGVADYAAGNIYLRKNGIVIASSLGAMTPGTTPDSDSLRTAVGMLTSGTQFFDGWLTHAMAFVPAAGLAEHELIARERYIGARMGVAF